MNKQTQTEQAERPPFKPTPKRRGVPRRGKTVVMSFSVPGEFAQRVKAMALAYDTTVSCLIREAVEYAQEHGQPVGE